MRSFGWMDQAACRGLDTANFFPPGTATPDVTILRTCQRCPVSSDCLTFSLRAPGQSVEHGFWAGMGEEERVNEKRRRLRRGELAA